MQLDAAARIEGEHQYVGMLDIIDRGVPGVQLDRADRHELKETSIRVTTAATSARRWMTEQFVSIGSRTSVVECGGR